MPGARRDRKRKGSGGSARPSLRQLAARLDVSPTAVRKWVAAGRFSKAAIATGRDGKPYVVDAEQAMREWRENRAKPAPSAGRQSSGARAHATRSESGRSPRGAGAAGKPEQPPSSLTEGVIRLNFQKELKLELENLQKRGVLIDAAIERRRDRERMQMARDAMQNIPDRLAAQLAAESDAARVHELLASEIRAALEALAEAYDADDDAHDADAGDGDAA